MKCRSAEKEILDTGKYTESEYFDCLEKLGKVGEWLGGDAATLSVFDRMHPKPTSILDVGCGGGIFTEKLAKKFPHAKVIGIDLNPLAIRFANKPYVELRTEPELNEPPKSFDVVTATLMCHHLTDAELVLFLKNAVMIAKRRVIINDLQRHPIAYYLFKWISPVLFRNRLVNHDGPISVKRGFTKAEWINYLHSAGIKSYRITWHWAFRWIIDIEV